MNKIILLLISLLSCVQISADDYDNLTLETSDNSTSVITSVGTVITFTDNKLVAVNGEERYEIDLPTMYKMYFTEGSFLMGDVNNDGEISVTDVMMMVNHILGVPNLGFRAQRADIDSDKSISLSDVVSVVSIVLSN